MGLLLDWATLLCIFVTDFSMQHFYYTFENISIHLKKIILEKI